MKTTERRERTKKYLNQISVFNCRISRREKWIRELETYKDHMDPSRYQKYIDESHELIESYTGKRDELISQIVTLPDQYANLLLMIYVKNIKVTDLPSVIEYSVTHIVRLHSAAIDLFYKQYGSIIDYVTPLEDDDDQQGI